MVRMVFERLGLKSHHDGDDLIVPPEQRLRVKDDAGDAIPKIDDGRGPRSPPTSPASRWRSRPRPRAWC